MTTLTEARCGAGRTRLAAFAPSAGSWHTLVGAVGVSTAPTRVVGLVGRAEHAKEVMK